MDVTPRPSSVADGPPTGGSRRRGLRVGLALVVVLGALGFVVARGLDDATLYFYNADEAVARRADLADSRFRLQGTVVDGTVEQVGDAVRFAVAHQGSTVDVEHVGDPPELFQPGIPVVLEGRWQGAVFDSDRIMVKHSSEYKAEHPDRVPAGQS